MLINRSIQRTERLARKSVHSSIVFIRHLLYVDVEDETGWLVLD